MLIRTLGDIEKWCEDLQHTINLTFRIQNKPRWCARIFRHGRQGIGPDNYYEGYGDTLAEAFEGALEMFTATEDV